MTRWMLSYESFLIGSFMGQIKSRSEVFQNFIKEVDKVLSKTETTDAVGNPMEYSNHHFQEQLKRLCQIHMAFDDMPIFPINEVIATNLIWDEIENKIQEQDAERDI